jgi:hypothetical protein
MSFQATRPGRLFVPIVNVVYDDVNHDGAFWGIRFPIGPFSFYQTTVGVIKHNLKTGGDAVLNAGLEGLDLAAILFAVVVEADGKFIEHRCF